MDKKEYLIKILTQLEPVWSLAKWLKILVEQWHLDDNLLDIITQAIEWAIHTTKNEISKEKLRKSLAAIEKIRKMEEESREQDEQDLAELEKLLEEI